MTQWPYNVFLQTSFNKKGGGQKLRDTGIANLNNYSLGWDCYGGTSGSQLHLGKNVSEFGFKEQWFSYKLLSLFLNSASFDSFKILVGTSSTTEVRENVKVKRTYL